MPTRCERSEADTTHSQVKEIEQVKTNKAGGEGRKGSDKKLSEGYFQELW